MKKLLGLGLLTLGLVIPQTAEADTSVDEPAIVYDFQVEDSVDSFVQEAPEETLDVLDSFAEMIRPDHTSCYGGYSGASFYEMCTNNNDGIYYAHAKYRWYKYGTMHYAWAWGTFALPDTASRGCVTYYRSNCAYRWTPCPVATCTIVFVTWSHG